MFACWHVGMFLCWEDAWLHVVGHWEGACLRLLDGLHRQLVAWGKGGELLAAGRNLGHFVLPTKIIKARFSDENGHKMVNNMTHVKIIHPTIYNSTRWELVHLQCLLSICSHDRGWQLVLLLNGHMQSEKSPHI